MEGTNAQRIVFGGDIPVQSTPGRQATEYTYFIPPSERANLPSNLIVTSVDVEEGLWPKRRGSRPKRVEGAVLSYGEDETTSVSHATDAIGENSSIDWDAIEKNLTSYPPVDLTLRVGNTVGYKVGQLSTCG